MVEQIVWKTYVMMPKKRTNYPRIRLGRPL